MKKFFNYSMLFAAALTLSMGMASCSSNDDNGGNTNGGSSTDNTTTTVVLNGTDAMVEEAGTEWKKARQDWEWSEAFLFGAATDLGIDPHTDTWPFDRTAFDGYMAKFNPATNEKDAGLIDDAIANGQNLTGFHAVEYLIFREGNSRKIADMTADEVYFAQSAATDLYLSSLKLVSAWGGELAENEETMLEDAGFESRDYKTEFLTAGQTGSTYTSITQATRQIIAGAQDIIGEVRDAKIGAPATGEDINYIESPHAYNSIQDFYDNILSCKHTLYGGWTVTEQPTTASLIGVCLRTPALKTAAETVENKLDAALIAISNMEKPFVLNYTDAKARTAMDALQELEDALTDLDDLIEGYDGNAQMEAYFKTVNEDFVNKTVIPTYRALADNDLKLLDALNKITWTKK